MGNNKKKYTIGIDIGGTKILACLLSKDFDVLSEIKAKTKPEKGERFFIKSIVDAVPYLLRDAKVNVREVIGIGIGCPGFIDSERGVIAASPNIPFLKNYPLAKRITKRVGLPVTLGNDVQTGLYGEHQFGSARGYDNVIGIFMGTGIGGALILNGKPYRGTSGSAGEVGHVKMDFSGPACGCGNYGCLEAFAGRLAISSEAAILAARQQAPYISREAGTDIRDIKSGTLGKAIRAGDDAIENLIRHKAKRVGLFMANLVNILNPDMIVLGGGVVEAMPSLIARQAEKTMRRYALPTSLKHVKVAVAKLGDHSIVMGAAKRADDMFGEKRHKERRHG
jgi:glucokinase